MSCMMDGAGLASINTPSEHAFISQWLMANDPAINSWYTSGVIDEETLWMKWEGDGTEIQYEYWLNEDHRKKAGDHIVYIYGVTEYRWTRMYSLISLPYICEISPYEAYKIVKQDRDFDFGSNFSDPALAPRGPKFIFHQQSVVVVRTDVSLSAKIEFLATGNPIPKYTIIYRNSVGNITDMSAKQDNRYSITNGKLTIHSPMESVDAGIYYCIAQNEFGLVMSNPMTLSFGYLAEFSNIDPAPVYSKNDDRAVIDCIAPNHRPAVTFQWYKGNYHFIRPDLHPYMFISRNGRLYFSIVSLNDAGSYRCIVKLASNNGAAIGTNQPPSRISLPIPLVVENAAAAVWGPEIANDFIFVYPTTPKRGQNVYLECLAYGSMPIYYTWQRHDLPMPINASLEDNNRVLAIPTAQVEDSGNYSCTASRLNSGSDTKSFYLSIEAEPFFLFPLKDQHIDQGSQLTWHCAARGIPKPTYFWIKDGVRMTNVEGEITINNNVLVIQNADPAKHNGMYQCGAENKHGISHTEGQLRVLGFTPTFVKFPVEEVVYGAEGGNATFTCHPESAPYPLLKWLKDGTEMNLIAGDTNSRIILLTNGNVLITQLSYSDQGYYTCRVENSFGSASSTGQLVVTSQTVINGPPSNTITSNLNETVFIRCQASASHTIDLIYTWSFNRVPLQIDNDVHFTQGSSQFVTGLFIRMVQHKHAGRYECQAKTPMSSVNSSSILTVEGPPGPISYVYVESGTITATTARLAWVLGAKYNHPVLFYKIEMSIEPFMNWTTLLHSLPETDVVAPIEDANRRFYIINGLRPGSSLKFRVAAANVFGLGVFGLPSALYQTQYSPPLSAPDNVGGGTGSVADLTITWDPLPTEEHGGPGIGYRIYWRLEGADRWLNAITNNTQNFGNFVTQVGVDNYYRPYEVMVQPFNSLGNGPNSSIALVYSAEALPIVAVTGVNSYRFNSTAIMITWAPVNNSREVMKGKIMGYQVNYWERYQESPIENAISWRTLDTHGLIIGLLPNTWYAYNVQVFNTAGLNSRGDTYFQRTTRHAPLLYPTEVSVSSHGSESVYVQWRGIMTGPDEESLRGYKVKYWLYGDDSRQAFEVTTGRENHATINGISKGELYLLRLHGVSRGGDGNPGDVIYFTLGGQVVIDSTVSEIKANGYSITANMILIICLCMYVLF